MTIRRHLGAIVKVAAFSVLSLLCILLLATVFWFKAALVQSEPVSRFSIAIAAAKMEISGSDISSVGPSVWLKRAYKNGAFQQDSDALDKLLARHGWKHTDEEGSLRIYTRGKSGLRIECQMYSGRYQICKAQGPL